MTDGEPGTQMVRVAEIQWALESPPRIESVSVDDLLALDRGELLEYAYDLQRAIEAVRALLSAALTALLSANTQRDGLQSHVRALVTELHGLRETVRNVSAQLRAFQDEAE